MLDGAWCMVYAAFCILHAAWVSLHARVRVQGDWCVVTSLLARPGHKPGLRHPALGATLYRKQRVMEVMGLVQAMILVVE